jgi:polyisoprenyl-phosphate glycosyltransferase
MAQLSIVVPCFNEQDALPTFFKEVLPSIDAETNGDWEIIVVDDGGHDDTWQIIKNHSDQDKRIHGISLSRNFGHQPALDTGLTFASGKYIAVLDCDLQDPLEVLIQLIRKVRDEGYDVCYGVRQKRDAPLALRFLYKLFYRVMGLFAENTWPLDAGDFSVFNRRVLHALLAMPESIRMLRGLRSWVGLKQAYVTYDRPARTEGTSKYNFFGLSSLAIRALVGFSQVPLRIASLIGFSMVLLSIALGMFFVVNRIIPELSPFGFYIGQNPGITTVVVLMLFVSSMLFLCLGIMGEYMSVIIKEIKRRPTAIVKMTAGNPIMQVHEVPIMFLPDSRGH